MRLCIVNPHTFLGKTAFSTLFRFKHFSKYDHLLSYFEPPYNAAICIDGTATSLSAGSTKFPFIFDNYLVLRILTFFEIYFWCFLNKINPFNHEIIFHTESLNTKNDVLFGFAFLSDTFIQKTIYKKSFFARFNGTILLHANHYFSRVHIISNLLQKIGITAMVAETDLTKEPFFQKYFFFIKKVIILSFVFQPRFQNKTPFKKRENTCLATGGILIMDNQDPGHKSFTQFFHYSSLHPMREMLFHKTSQLKGLVDVKIHEAQTEPIKNGKYKNVLLMLRHIIFPSQRKYTFFNIVGEFNKHQLFIAPEEAIGLPTVSFVEGMACGCAFIGLNNHMYTDLGMKDKINFIAYDGTIADLKKKIRYYQSHEKELETIAKNGERFVRAQFTQKKVLSTFYNELKTYHTQNKNT